MGVRLPKRIIPFIYFLVSAAVSRGSDCSGFVCGIIAALIIKYSPMYILRILPQQKWIKKFEEDYFFVSDIGFVKSIKNFGYQSPKTDEILDSEFYNLFCCTAAFENFR